MYKSTSAICIYDSMDPASDCAYHEADRRVQIQMVSAYYSCTAQVDDERVRVVTGACKLNTQATSDFCILRSSLQEG